MGIPNNHGGCCTISDRNFIIGPHSDTQEFLERLSEKFGREILYKEVFVDYEEGKSLFPNKSMWQKESNYPALRVNFFQPSLPCIFYNTTIRACSIYDVRPKTCQIYECEYLQKNTDSYNG